MNFTLGTKRITVAVASILILGVLEARTHSTTPPTTERARILFTQPLPKLDGDHLKTTLVAVHYGPGEASPPHRHPCAVIGHVIRGAVRTQIEDRPVAVYKTGDTFYEPPNQLHAISANSSTTEPADFLAYFVCDSDAPLSMDAAMQKGEGGR
jgi:quercetin dioxygenase-like cupin family protein